MRYFEDFNIGDRFVFGAFAMRAEEMSDYAQKYDPQPSHVDDGPRDDSGAPGNGVIASGFLILAIMLRLMVDEFDDVAMQGSPGWDEIRWLRPVRAGDTLSVECVLTEARASRGRPELGVMRSRLTMLNQAGEPVLSAEPAWFVRRRPE
jgi:acyl dehydratase